MISCFPRLKAISALGVGVPLLLVVFAAVYYLIEWGQPTRFTQQLDKTGALYFAITVFATVGFGDIAPVSGVARILVSFQMLLDLAVFGVVAKVVLGCGSGRTTATVVGQGQRRGEVTVAAPRHWSEDAADAIADLHHADDDQQDAHHGLGVGFSQVRRSVSQGVIFSCRISAAIRGPGRCWPRSG